MISIDAYLHMTIHHHCQSFIRFKVEDIYLKFQCLPFGISTAPRTFKKVLVAILELFREQGIRVLHLGDILILSQSRETLLAHLQEVRIVFSRFGRIIN